MPPKIGAPDPSGYRGAVEESLTPRPLTQEDASAAAALVRIAFAAQSVATDPPSSALRLSTTDLLAHLAAGGGGAVVPAGARTAGSVLWAEQDGGLYVFRLAVAPDFRRRGIAGMLLRAAEAAARARGLPRLHLRTRLVLADNRALFAHCGFSEVGRETHPGYAEPTSARLEKRLA